MKPIFAVYMITNSINGKVYIGATRDYHNRKLAHISTMNGNLNSKTIISNPMYIEFCIYGKDCFVFEVLKTFKEKNCMGLWPYEREMINLFNQAGYTLYNRDVSPNRNN